MPWTASRREQEGNTVMSTHIAECAPTRNHAASDSSSKDSEDDDVVATFPVYFVPALTAQTHVFQFPLRTLDRAYEMRDATLLCTRGAGALCAMNDSNNNNCNSNTHVEIDMRRRAGEGVIGAASRLTLHCTLDTFGSTSFASPDGSQGCGHNLVATATLPSAYMASKGLPMQCSSSSLSLTSSSHSTMYNYRLQAHPFSARSDYLVGYIGSGGVHLTPVATVQQFAPLLRQHSEDVGEDDAHRSGGGNTTTTTTSNSIDVSNKSGGRGGAAALVARVPLAFCSAQTTPLIAGLPGTDRIQRELLRCRSTMLNRDADTAYAMLFFASYTIESCAMRRRLVSMTREQPRWSPSQPSSIAHVAKTRSGSNTEAVVDSLFPPEIVVSGGIAGGEEATEATILHRFAARHTIAQQVQQLMERCQVLPLETLVDYVVMPGDAAADTTTITAMTKSSRRERAEAHVVNALRMCAMPMHGVWVSCSCNRFVGIAAALREVVLLRFYESADATVTRADLNEVAPSSTLRRVVLDILHSVAVLQELTTTTHTRRRWRLRCVHHAASAAIEQHWQERYPTTATLFRDAWVRRVQGIVTHVPHLLACRTPPRLFLLSCEKASSGSNSKRSNNNSDYDSCMANCSALAMSSASAAAMMTTTTTETTTPANTLSALHRDEQRVLPAVRTHIRALFAEYGVLNKQRAKELLLRGREIHYPDATNAMLATALQSCVRTFTPSTWVLQELGEPAVDRYRVTILDIVRDLQTFTTRAVQMRLAATVCAHSDDADAENSNGTVHNGDDDATPNNASDNDSFISTCNRNDAMMTRAVQRVLAEVADYKMAERLWHVKSGNVMQTLL